MVRSDIREDRTGTPLALTLTVNDMVFADSIAQETATISGSAAGGYSATFTINVAA
jgi:hypothetical protein